MVLYDSLHPAITAQSLSLFFSRIITNSPLEPRQSSTPNRRANFFVTFTVHIPSALPFTKGSQSASMRFDLVINDLILHFPSIFDVLRFSKRCTTIASPFTSTSHLVITVANSTSGKLMYFFISLPLLVFRCIETAGGGGLVCNVCMGNNRTGQKHCVLRRGWRRG